MTSHWLSGAWKVSSIRDLLSGPTTRLSSIVKSATEALVR